MYLNTPGKDGVTPRAHFEQYERQTGKCHPKLVEQAEVPEGCEFIWEVFSRFKRKGEAITYQDISAYKEVTGIALASFEVEALFRMDAVFTEFIGEQTKNA